MLQIILSFILIMSSSTTEKDFLPKKSERMLVVKTAKSLLNTKYKYGGKNTAGFDCSGFTYYVYKKAANIKLAASSKLQSKQGRKVKLKKAQPGDLVFFKRSGKTNHVGIIYKIEGKSLWVIHATSSKGVILEDVNKSSYWRNKVSSIKRML